MKPMVDPRRVSGVLAVSRAASVVGFVGGGTVLVGWQLDGPALTSILPGRVAMNPLTALGCMLAAVALWTCLPTASARSAELGRVARVAAALVALIGGVTLAGDAIGLTRRLGQHLARS